MHVAIILPAAGSAARYQASGAFRHKLDEDLGGKPLLQRTVEVFTKFDSDAFTLSPILVAGPHDADDLASFKERHADRLGLLGAAVIPGGQSHRWQTVRAALAHVPASCDLVAVHDAARPCVTTDLLGRVLEAAARFGAAIPALRVSDTLKAVAESTVAPPAQDRAAAILGLEAPSSTSQRFVTATTPRDGLVMVQTPQVFRRDWLVSAYEGVERLGRSPTDDSEVVEAYFASPGGPPGARVAVVEGDPRNIKVTFPADLGLARSILGYREAEGRPVHKRF